jgi:tRNA-specific 2-thiouridylase
VKINPVSNQITLGSNDDLYQTHLWASRTNFPSDVPLGEPVSVTAKIRYKASESPATITVHDGSAEIRFDEPQRAITPGQAVVFYQDDELVGGGIIEVEPPSKTAMTPSIKAAATV